MPKHTRSTTERGQAVVETAIALPLVLLLMMAMIDTARYVIVWSAVDRSATEVARLEHEALAGEAQPLRDVAINASPNLAGTDLSVRVAIGPKTTREYTHHLYDHDTSSYIDRTSIATSRDCSVTVVCSSDWLTPVGAAVGRAVGMDGGRMIVQSTKSRVCDMTMDEGTW